MRRLSSIEELIGSQGVQALATMMAAQKRRAHERDRKRAWRKRRAYENAAGHTRTGQVIRPIAVQA